jgi:hypothetical protein
MIRKIKYLAEIIKVIYLKVMEMGLLLYAIYIANKKNNITNTISRTKEYSY